MKKKPKILMLLQSFDIGGAETHVLELSLELEKQGYEVAIASNGGVFEEKLEGSKVQHYRIPLHNTNPINIIRSYFTLNKLIKKEKFDIVHSHTRISGFLTSLLSNKNTKFLSTVHLNFKTSFPYNLFTRWGEHAICVSPDIREYVIENYKFNSYDTSLTINGINTETFQKTEKSKELIDDLNIDINKKTIVHISRIDKGPADVAFQLLDIARELDDYQIMIIGGGNEFDKLKSLSEKKNEELKRTAIILTGGVTDIARYINLADIFIGVSRAALEAMACEKPVILSGYQGHLGILAQDNLENAFESNFTCRGLELPTTEKLLDDIKGIAGHAIAAVLRSFQSPSALGSSSRNDGGGSSWVRDVIKEKYSVKQMTASYISAYETILAKRISMIGYYGYKNAGDDIIMQIIINNIKAISKSKITVFSYSPAETAKRSDVNSVYRFSLWGIIRTLRKTDVFIVGGGSIFQDITSSKSLYYYVFFMLLAKFFGIKIYIYANGIGPVLSKVNGRLLRFALNRADFITLRDENSFGLIKPLVERPKLVLQTTDPAFQLEKGASENAFNLGRKYCVLALRNIKNSAEVFEKLANVINETAKKHDLTVYLLNMQTYDIQSSIEISGNIKNSIIIGSHLSTDEILALFHEAEFAISMRLHALILSSIADCIGTSISSDVKIESFSKILEQGFLTPDFTENQLKLNIQDMIDLKEENKLKLKERLLSEKEKTKIDLELLEEILND